MKDAVRESELLSRAEAGDATAQAELGTYYQYDAQDAPEEAVTWYRRAAEQGHAGAQHNLGYCYLWGEGVPADMEEAHKWFRKAAAQGVAASKRIMQENGMAM